MRRARKFTIAAAIGVSCVALPLVYRRLSEAGVEHRQYMFATHFLAALEAKSDRPPAERCRTALLWALKYVPAPRDWDYHAAFWKNGSSFQAMIKFSNPRPYVVTRPRGYRGSFPSDEHIVISQRDLELGPGGK